MKSTFALVALCYIVASSKAAPSLPVNPGGIGGLFKGPNSETIIQGPDGSLITSAAEGGEVLTEGLPIVVAEPIIEEVAAPISVITEPVAIAAPAPVIVEGDKTQRSDLVGPSGAISTRGQESIVAGPASTTITDPAGNTAETVPIIGNTAAVVPAAPALALPVATVTASPSIASAASVAPAIALSSVPVATGLTPIQTDLGLASVTASPLSIQSSTLGGLDISLSTGNIALGQLGVTAGPPLALVTPLQSVATASSSASALATVTGIPNLATASINSVDVGQLLGVTALPPISSTLSPAGLVGINDHIDLGPQLNLNPALIPSANIIPPEIALSSTPATILSSTTGLTPQVISSGLPTATNIQRNEAVLQQTPNDLLLNNNNVNRGSSGVLISPNGNPIGLGGTTDPRLLTAIPRVVNVVPKLAQLDPNEAQLLQNGGSTVSTLSAIQEQDLINAELARVGADGGQILQQPQPPTGPLLRNTRPCCDEVNPITSSDLNSNSAPAGENWSITTRYGREATKKD